MPCEHTCACHLAIQAAGAQSDAAFNLLRASEDEKYAAADKRRPSVLYRPHLAKDGDMWSALYGDNIQEGVCGFGETPDLAMRDFDSKWMGVTTVVA